MNLASCAAHVHLQGVQIVAAAIDRQQHRLQADYKPNVIRPTSSSFDSLAGFCSGQT